MTAALHIQGLKKSFGGLPATNDVSLEVMPGERRLIIGPNGAGKTTLFNLITGDLKRDAGTIKMFGEEVQRLRPHQRAHRGLARTYQIITLFAGATLEHNVALSLLGLHAARWNMFAALAGYGHLYDEARGVLPKVLLLDEPFAGLSREERAAVGQLIAGIPRETTLIMIEHDMDVALDLAERITVLHYGSVIVEGTRAEVVAHPKTREVYLGD